MPNFKTIILALFTFGVTSNLAHGAPGEATKRLIEDPASMMDLGLLKLDLWLSDVMEQLKTMNAKQVENYHTYSGYDWDDDKIIAGATLYVSDVSAEDAEQMCGQFINRFRIYSGVDIENGKLAIQDDTNTRISRLFSHDGFKRSSYPADAFSALDQRIYVHCDVMQKDGNRFIPYLSVSGPLMSSVTSTTNY